MKKLKMILGNILLWLFSKILDLFNVVITPIAKGLYRLGKGLFTDFWMLPVAIGIAFWHERIAMILNLFPPLNPEKVGNVIPALVVWLLILFLSRVYFFAQYNDVYRKSLMNKKNDAWNSLDYWQQFLFLRLERWVLLIVFALIYAAMM